MHVTAAGVEVPALGFGTARMSEYETEYRAVETALDAGYRHVDTAQIYGSEPAVGDALADSDLDREEVFLTTKLAGENRAYDAVVESTRESLEDLDTAYVDLLLIHWPVDDVPTEETLRAMNDLRDDGLVRHLGVSNFSVPQLREAREASDAPVIANQVEYNVGNRQDELLAYCIAEGVMVTAYSPLGVGELLGDETLGETAARHDKTAAQVGIRWLLQQPMVSTVPMSSSSAHVRENFDVFDFELSDAEMRELFGVGGDPDADLTGQLGL